MCGGNVEPANDLETGICDSCGTISELPDSEKLRIITEQEVKFAQVQALRNAVDEEESTQRKKQQQLEDLELQKLIKLEYKRFPLLRFLGFLVTFSIGILMIVWLFFVYSAAHNTTAAETLRNFPPNIIFASITSFLTGATSGLHITTAFWISAMLMLFVPFLIMFVGMMIAIPTFRVSLSETSFMGISIIIVAAYTFLAFLVAASLGVFRGVGGYVLGIIVYYFVGYVFFSIGSSLSIAVGEKNTKRLRESVRINIH